MSNPFSLKKEKLKSPYSHACMIIQADQGKGSLKRFLFDYNAQKAIPLKENTELGFIAEGDYIIIADLSKINKEEFNIKDEEVNKINKTKIVVEYNDEKFNFKNFANSRLYEFLLEELELNRGHHNIYAIQVATTENINKATYELLHRMDIKGIFKATLVDIKKSFSKRKLKKRPYDSAEGLLHAYVQSTPSHFGYTTGSDPSRGEETADMPTERPENAPIQSKDFI